jgi:hypothetical protein
MSQWRDGRIDVSPQVCNRALQLRQADATSYQLGHDERARRLGVRGGLSIGDARMAPALGISTGVEH